MYFREKTNDEDIYRDVYVNNEYNIDVFEPNDVVVDIGGHVGFFSLKAWDNGSREIHCFEPYIENFIALFNNTKSTKIHTYNFAVRGNYKYRTLSIDIGDNIRRQKIKNYGGLCLQEGSGVTVMTLEDIVKLINKPINFLKLDCEGSEYSIIMESPDYIFNNIENIVGEIHNCEVSTNKINGKPVSHDEFLNRLSQLGYITSYRMISEKHQIGYFSARKNDKYKYG